MTDTHAAALAILRTLVGRNDAVFHDGQYEAIETLVDQKKRALVVQRTGWGKSAVYFVATLLLRRQGAGPTILVSPLLALMRDQVAAAARAGVRAVSINSSNAHEWTDVLRQLNADEVDVLLVSPERLNNPSFRDDQLPALISRVGLLVVDEAHCISDWGHDFRPDYRRLRDLIAQMPAGVPVLATTATANSRVVHDVAEQVGMVGSAFDGAGTDGADDDSDDDGGAGNRGAGAQVITIRGPLARSSLRLGVLRLPDSQARLAWLLSHVGELPDSGIIYTLTVAAAEDTARLLREAGHTVRAYTGQTDTAEREESEGLLKANQIKALIATSALGMGFDKPDLGFVLHLGAPSSPVAYYQQVGRAGRATASADVLLLPGVEDEAIWHYFATASMPSQAKALAVIGALEAATGPLSTPALEARVDLKRTPLELLLKVLDVDGAVHRVKGGWQSTGQPWVYDGERYERIKTARLGEQQAMLEFENTNGCRMEFLQRALDDETAVACGRCDNCQGIWYPVDVAEEATATAAQSLDRVGVSIDARAQWPTGMKSLGVAATGKISLTERAEPGRALARLTDLGWGGALRHLFATETVDAPASPEMLTACVRVLAEWGWADRPAAIVSMPSRKHPLLIDSVAQSLSSVGRLPFLGSLTWANGGPTGQPGGNSAYRLSNVYDRFTVDPELMPALAAFAGRPILLVDDLADSRWTITVGARALRQHGASAVLPFTLGLRS